MIKRKVVIAPAASFDVIGVLDDVISTLGIDAAVAMNERIDAALESLATLAVRGRFVPELRVRGITAYRELLVNPLRIVYRVEPKEVWVVAVVDHRRDLDALLHSRARRDRR